MSDHLDLLEAAADAAAALDPDGSALSPYLAAYGAITPDNLDPADRTDIYLEIARHVAHVYGELVDAVRLLEASEGDPAA